jgi:hypothetical protein
MKTVYLFKYVLLAVLFSACGILPCCAQMTAKEWNKDVVGWNLGNQFECSAPGQDGRLWMPTPTTTQTIVPVLRVHV